jgi:hypothetical protein
MDGLIIQRLRENAKRAQAELDKAAIKEKAGARLRRDLAQHALDDALNQQDAAG